MHRDSNINKNDNNNSNNKKKKDNNNANNINKFLSILMTAELEEKAEATESEVNGVVSQNLEDLVCETKAEDVKDVIKEGLS